MKRAFYILFSLIILISCESENELEGVWIGAYQVHYSGDEPLLSSMRLLLDISKAELIYKTFDYPMFEERDSVQILKYSFNGKSLTLDSDTFLVKNLTKDSLVLNFCSNYERDLVFKRLPDNNNFKIDIKNKAFSLTGPNYADSIDFINDSLMLHIGNVFNTNYRSTKWAINSYKSFDFLVFDQSESPPFLIDYSFENEIFLKLFFTTIKDFKMTNIENVKDTSGIIGNWVCPFQNRQGVPLPRHLEGVDSKLYLRVKSDSLEIEQYGKIKSKKWKLNSTNNFIYFPEKINTKNGVWKILEVNEDKLIIERYRRNRKSYNPGDKEVIKFEKIKNSR
ncbi:hypothetical protein QUH73_20615 [Labilibaculum sp. K2S]|uniref:hypothetical protein n=1 Tax=Labilibaculum sp. K2S TaxID=3056386 RepID=UPI0025A389C2|nr:hypothetical protein [Labilibaculum sp. K2S]MDM8162229.1 hypothetical protein [Labilibaculum sp. K2S]